MSGRHVALLRGINVGRAKRVGMADLRTLMEELGYDDVRTLLNSGNVVFTARGVAARDAAGRIERAMVERLGVESRVTVLTAAELAVVIEENPLSEIADEPSRLLVAVLADPSDLRKVEPLLEQEWMPEVVALGRRVAYLWCPRGVGKSPLNEAVGRALGDAVTARNWRTLTRLHALARGG